MAVPGAHDIRPRGSALQQRRKLVRLAEGDIGLDLFSGRAGFAPVISLHHQVQVAAVGVAAHVKLQPPGGEAVARRVHQVNIGPRQAALVRDAAAAQDGGQEIGAVRLAVTGDPFQMLPAGGFIHGGGAAIGQGVHGKFRAGPDKRPARPGAMRGEIREARLHAEGKAADRDLAPVQRNAGHHLTAFQRRQLFFKSAGGDPPVGRNGRCNRQKRQDRRVEPETAGIGHPHLEYPQDRQESQPSSFTKLASL